MTNRHEAEPAEPGNTHTHTRVSNIHVYISSAVTEHLQKAAQTCITAVVSPEGVVHNTDLSGVI